MQNSTSNDDAGVPGVSDIPFLGNLFGQERKVNTRSELVILLKPVVVNSNRTWADYIRRSQERINNLQPAKTRDAEGE